MFWPRWERGLWSWDPWQDFRRLRGEVDRLFGDFLPRSREVFPPVNLHAGKEDLVLTAELPGIDPKALDISVLQRTVTIRGKRETEGPEDGRAYFRRERETGEFARSIELPYRVDADKVEARYEKGILTVVLPRVEEEKPKAIQVRAG